MTSVRSGRARALAWLAVAVAALLAIPTPVAAHATLIGSYPKDGATVQRLPDEVSLEFSEEVGSPAHVEVTAADGSDVGDGDPDVLGGVVTLGLASDGPAGTYTVAYRVVSADGHPVSGELTFEVTSGSSPGSPPPGSTAEPRSASEPQSDDEGFFSRHADHIAIAAVGLVAGGLLIGMGLRARA